MANESGFKSIPTRPIRLGILGTSRVAPYAVIAPARSIAGVQVTAVGGRNGPRTRHYAQRHAIPHSLTGYDALINDPRVDAVYVPLPVSLHRDWTIKALQAGKHVLCEKPLAANAAEAAAMRDAARAAGCVLMEAFHYRYHPLMQHVRDWIDRGVLGDIEHVEAKLKIFWLGLRDIRFDPQLGGGALLDAGCYTVNLIRFVKQQEPAVHAAQARRLASGVDTATAAQLVFPDGASARIECDLRAWPWQWRSTLKIRGSQGSLSVINPMVPHVFNRLVVRTAQQVLWKGSVRGESTYHAQLAAFVNAVVDGAAVQTDADDAVDNLQVIDAIEAMTRGSGDI